MTWQLVACSVWEGSCVWSLMTGYLTVGSHDSVSLYWFGSIPLVHMDKSESSFNWKNQKTGIAEFVPKLLLMMLNWQEDSG